MNFRQECELVLTEALGSELGLEIRCSDPKRVMQGLYKVRSVSQHPDAPRLRIQQSPWQDRSDLVIWKMPQVAPAPTLTPPQTPALSLEALLDGDPD